MSSTVILKPDRDYAVSRRHPWVYSGAVAKVEGKPAPGDTVAVCTADGVALGTGAWSPESQIRVRMWDWDASLPIDEAFFARRVADAVKVRAPLAARAGTDAMRLVHGEADGLPGVIADRYADFIVCQFSTTGADRWKASIARALADAFPCKGVFERSAAEARAREGLVPSSGPLLGETPPECIVIHENGCSFEVNVHDGQKTGFYLDQRDNRAFVAQFAKGAEMLDAFCYTGGFGVVAGRAGASHVTHVDLSGPSLALARRNAERNGGTAETDEFVEANVFDQLRRYRDARRTFDLVVLDPPKFVDAKSHLMAGCRGYKDINLLAMKLLRPGGFLATFSCSGLVTPDIFHKVVAEAAVDSGRDVQVLRRLQQAPDHPEGIAFPEGLYLKGLLCRIR
ncbi:MAG: class I SAM-dependent rRNA methyltransferase [Kiritimatiellia bacterium]